MKLKNDAAVLGALLVCAGGAWWYWNRQQSAGASGVETPGDRASLLASMQDFFQPVADAVQTVSESVVSAITPGPWTPPASAAPYLDAIYAAEDANGIPRNLLARQLWQESRYRPDIINGGPNRAGAIGIAQIIPRWNPGVDPSDPFASIDYAARKMSGLFRRYGSWKLALAAYNWGEGNLANVENSIARSPLETRNYVAQITGDVPVA